MTTDPVRTRRWTRAEYDQLIDVGILEPGDPIELLGGELMVAERRGVGTTRRLVSSKTLCAPRSQRAG